MNLIERSILRAIDEAADGDRHYRVTLEDPGNSLRWLQISWDTFNACYPATDHPLEYIRALDIKLPDCVGVEDWKPMEFVTFSHCAHSSTELARFLELFMLRVAHVNDFAGWKVEE